MESLDDLTPNNLRELGEDWAALAYACRNSFLMDASFEEFIGNSQWADDLAVIKDCIEAATLTEDSILKCGWLMGEIAHEAGEEEDIDIE